MHTGAWRDYNSLKYTFVQVPLPTGPHANTVLQTQRLVYIHIHLGVGEAEAGE